MYIYLYSRMVNLLTPVDDIVIQPLWEPSKIYFIHNTVQLLSFFYVYLHIRTVWWRRPRIVLWEIFDLIVNFFQKYFNPIFLLIINNIFFFLLSDLELYYQYDYVYLWNLVYLDIWDEWLDPVGLKELISSHDVEYFYIFFKNYLFFCIKYYYIMYFCFFLFFAELFVCFIKTRIFFLISGYINNFINLEALSIKIELSANDNQSDYLQFMIDYLNLKVPFFKNFCFDEISYSLGNKELPPKWIFNYDTNVWSLTLTSKNICCAAVEKKNFYTPSGDITTHDYTSIEVSESDLIAYIYKTYLYGNCIVLLKFLIEYTFFWFDLFFNFLKFFNLSIVVDFLLKFMIDCKIFDFYLDVCSNFLYVLKLIFSKIFFYQVFIFFFIGSVINIFFFSMLLHSQNIFFSIFISKSSVETFKHTRSAYFVGYYNVLYKFIYKFIFFKKFFYFFESPSRSYYRPLWRFDNPMKFYIKMKVKLKIKTKYFKIRINATRFIWRKYHLWVAKEMRHRQRYVTIQWSKWFKSHKMTKPIYSRSGTARKMRSQRFFATGVAMRRVLIYSYIKCMYWGYDNDNYNRIVIDKYYNYVIPNTKPLRSLHWFWRSMDRYAWNTPYACQGLQKYSSGRWRCHKAFDIAHPQYLMIRYPRRENWRPPEPVGERYFNNWTKSFIAKRLHRYGYQRFWKGFLPSIKDYWNISGFDITNFNIPDFDDFNILFKFFLKFFK